MPHGAALFMTANCQSSPPPPSSSSLSTVARHLRGGRSSSQVLAARTQGGIDRGKERLPSSYMATTAAAASARGAVGRAGWQEEAGWLRHRRRAAVVVGNAIKLLHSFRLATARRRRRRLNSQWNIAPQGGDTGTFILCRFLITGSAEFDSSFERNI